MSSLRAQKKTQNNQSANIPDSKKIQNYIYRFCDQIGKGNFSKVYKGIHQITNRQVAIKTIQLHSLDTPRLKELLNTETVILKMLNHPNIIKCVQILSSLRNCYIITQLCNSGDLDAKLRKVGTFEEADLYEIVLDVYQGLKYLSSKKIVHRDIKASNIFLHNGVHKIADFGFAQVCQKQFSDVSVGSPIYMSPEGFIDNKYSLKTDVWAFGIMLFQLAEGHTPSCNSRSEEQLKVNMRKQIDRSWFKSKISDSYKDLVMQCLKIDHNKRPKVEQLETCQWIKKARKQIIENKHPRKSEDKNFGAKMNNISQIIASRNSSNNGSSKFDKLLTGNKSLNIREYSKNQESQTTKQMQISKQTFYKPSSNYENKSNNKDQKIFYSPKNVPNTLKNCLKKLDKNPSNDCLKLQNYKNKFSFIQDSLLTPQQNQNQNKRSFSSQRNKQNQNSSYCIRQSANVKNQPIYNSPKYSSKEHGVNQHPVIHKIKNKDFIRQSDILKPSENILQSYKKYFYRSKDHERKSYQNEERSKKLERRTRPTFMKQFESQIIAKSIDEEYKIFKRVLKFRDCIGLIHYCRLSYKLACLLQDIKEEHEAKLFFTNWCILILEQIMLKIKNNDILYGNEVSLMNNPSSNENDADKQKKRKLKDVTEEYLKKYQEYSAIDKQQMTVKQACNFIYEFYLTMAENFKQKSDTDNPTFFAKIRYLGQIYKQSRILVEFSRQIKDNFDGKNIQKLLTMKLTSFKKKDIQDMFLETY